METDSPQSKHQEWILWGLVGLFVWLVGLFRVVFVYGGCEVQKKMQLYVASILVGDFFIGPVLK